MRQHNMDAAFQQAAQQLSLPEHRWAAEAVQLYLDSKDHLRLSPAELTPWGAACFRAIRQGSGGLLGTHSL